jgi:arylsulfatase A-like enzyme
MDHQFCLYQTLLHVPLVIRYPQAFDAVTDDRLVETRQVFETVCELSGAEQVTQYDTGQSLLALGPSADYAVAEYTEPQPSISTLEEQYGTLPEEMWTYDRAPGAIQDGTWKLVERSDGSSQLYNLDADPYEMSPVNDTDHEEALHDELIKRRGILSGPQHEQANIDDASKARLEDLGYL